MKKEYSAEEALTKLIGLERDREHCNMTGECVICGKPANGKHYPAPFHPDSSNSIRSRHPAVWYRACGRAHADRFYNQFVSLHNDVLRPWRAIHNAHLRREKVITLADLGVTL